MPESPAADKKLREAAFFVAKLRESDGAPNLAAEAFDFYLSAFLSAARSVTFVIQAEHKPIYDAWFPVWLGNLLSAERELMDLIKDERNLALKTGATSRGQTHGTRPAIEVLSTQRAPFVWDTEATIDIARHYFVMGGVERPAVELCSECLALLQRLMAEFRTQ